MAGWRIPLVGALALATALTPIGPVVAAPPALMPPGIAKAETGSSVMQVRGRSFRGHYGHFRHRNGGRNLAIGLGIGIIGGMIAAEAYRGAPGYAYDEEVYDGADDVPPDAAGDPREQCAQAFRSFEWSTGMYTTYSGEKKLCPYLR